MASDITEWLEGLALSKYASAFAEAEIDLAALPYITEQDLKDLGLPIGPRRKVLAAINDVRSRETELSENKLSGAATDSERETQAQQGAERRQLTALFADVVGSTAMAQTMDPEDLRTVLRSFQQVSTNAIARYEGHIAKFMGDGLLAYFGWPRAHEDDAERAVRAGLALAAAVQTLERPLSIRVGIATGLAVVGDVIGDGSAKEEAAIGETLNLAARLQQEAPLGAVVVAPSTRALLGQIFELENLGHRELKGIEQSIPLWRVADERSIESRFAASQTHQQCQLIGRDEEIALATARWERAKAGEGQVLRLRAEPGIGKSRLVVKLRECLGRDAVASVLCQCSPHHVHSPLYPVIQHITRTADLRPHDAYDTKVAKALALLEQRQAMREDAARLLRSLLSIPGTNNGQAPTTSPEQEKAATFALLIDLLIGAAKAGPMILVFEDLHWVDPTTRELLDLIVERIESLPVLLIVSFRPDIPTPWEGLGHATLLSLDRLSKHQTAALVVETAGKALPQSVINQIVAKTDGVPLFAEELTKALLESGFLIDVGDHYELKGALPLLAVPSSLQASLVSRLDRLAPVRETAQIAAALGREFDFDLLVAVAAQHEGRVAEALAELHRAELVFPRGVAPRTSWTFKHALIQEAAYETLLKSARVGLHARIADTIRTRFSDLADTEPETLARHYQEASDVVQACEFWRRAGEMAAAKNSGAEAVGYFEGALDQASKIHDEVRRQSIVFELRLLLGDAQMKAGFVHDALTTFALTATEARQTANEPAFVKSALGHSLAALYASEPLDASIVLLDEALATWPTDKAESKLRLLNALGRSLSLSGHAERAATVSGTAISLARQLGDWRGLMETLEQSFFTPTGLNEAQIHEYRERLVELVSTAHGTGDVSAYGRALSLQVCWSAEFGDANTLTEALQKYADVADKYRIIYLMASVRHAKAMQAILNGDFALGESCAEEALEFGRGSFGSNADGPYGIQIFTIRREQGRLGEIAPLLKRFIDEGLGGAVWKPGFALIASDLGFEAPARRILDEFASRNFELPIDGKRSATLSYLAEVAVRLRDKTRARQIYELLLPYRFMTITIGIDVVCYGAATRFLGLLASTFDDEEAAVEHFEHALELNTQLRAWPWLAHTQADYAAFLKRRDHASSMERSQQLLAEAAETAERLGMTFLLRRLKEMDYSD